MTDSAKSQHTLETVPIIRNALIQLQAGDGNCLKWPSSHLYLVSRTNGSYGPGSVVNMGTEVFISMHLHVALLGSLIGFFPRTFACGHLCSSTGCGLMILHFLKETRYGWGHSEFCVSCHCVRLRWHLEYAEPGGHSGHLAWEMWAGLGQSHRLEVHLA